MNDSIRQLNIADEPLEVESIKTDLAGVGIDEFVVEDDRDIKLRIARQPEACRFVACIELVEDEVEAFQSLVSIFGGVVDAMIVILQRTQRFIDVTVRLVSRGKSRLLCGEVVIKILSAEEPATWTTVAFGSGVEVVQVR